MIGAPYEWEETKGADIKVAVLDTGRPVHKDIKVIDSINVSSARDDIDYDGHAHHVSGIICANGGILGVAPEINLYTAKVLDDQGRGTDETIAKGVRWATSKRVDVINMSLGGADQSPLTHAAIQDAVRKNIIVVCAAGNAGKAYMAYPAKYPETIAVAAVDITKTRPEFSSVGKEVEVAAAGVEVLSCWKNGGYSRIQGTSMACPHIAGAVALFQAKAMIRYRRKLTLQEIRLLLHMYAEDLGEPGRDRSHGFGTFSFGRFNKDDYVII